MGGSRGESEWAIILTVPVRRQWIVSTRTISDISIASAALRFAVRKPFHFFVAREWLARTCRALSRRANPDPCHIAAQSTMRFRAVTTYTVASITNVSSRKTHRLNPPIIRYPDSSPMKWSFGQREALREDRDNGAECQVQLDTHGVESDDVSEVGPFYT